MASALPQPGTQPRLQPEQQTPRKSLPSRRARSTPFTRAELLTLLNTLIEDERAGALGVKALANSCQDPAIHQLLELAARDEARYCAMLIHHVRKMGAEPSQVVGKFRDKLLAREGLAAQLDLLNRGQGVVADILGDSIPWLEDYPELQNDLADMRAVHLDNIRSCAAAAAKLPL